MWVAMLDKTFLDYYAVYMDGTTNKEAKMARKHLDKRWSQLEDKLSEVLGQEVRFSVKYEDHNLSKKISLNGEDLIEHAGIFQRVFSKAWIEGYGREDIGRTVVILNLKWSQISGGRNGTELMSGVYQRGEWEFTVVGEE